MQSHSVHDPAQFHLDSFHSKQDTVVGICHVGNNHFLTNQMFSEYHVASFASTHSKTRHSDVYDAAITDDVTTVIFTLMTKFDIAVIPCTEK